MLTDKALRALKPREKPYKRSDEKGLYVIVRPDGAVWWRFKYRYGAVEKGLSFGTYPDVTLKRAREKRAEARVLLDREIDPAENRKARKAMNAGSNSFKAVAEDWINKGCPPRKGGQNLADVTMRKNRWLLGKLYPVLGTHSVDTIEPPDLLKVLRRVESEGKHETARRCLRTASRVFRYAIRTGRATRDPAPDLADALIPQTVVHRPAITEGKAFGALLRKIGGYGGQPATKAALELLALTFVRPGELRLARWREVDLEGESPKWVVPLERMKMRNRDGATDHVVPLSTQAVALLEGLRPITDRGPDSYVFPSLRPGRPLSENTLAMALRSLDVDTKVDHCPHGFRASASSILHELGWDSDVIEAQLAHTRPGVGGIYNRSIRLAERTRLMQAWANHLDALRGGATVTAIRKER